MAQFVLYNKKGMSLIEVMIALVILMVVALAVMQTAMVGMNANLQDSIRNEAVKIVDQRVEELRTMATGTFFDGGTPNIGDLTAGTYTEADIVRQFRGAEVHYSPMRTISSMNTGTSVINTKQVTFTVSWPFRNNTYTHTVTTIMRRQ